MARQTAIERDGRIGEAVSIAVVRAEHATGDEITAHSAGKVRMD